MFQKGLKEVQSQLWTGDASKEQEEEWALVETMGKMEIAMVMLISKYEIIIVVCTTNHTKIPVWYQQAQVLVETEAPAEETSRVLESVTTTS